MLIHKGNGKNRAHKQKGKFHKISHMKTKHHGRHHHNAFPMLAKSLLKHALQFHKEGKETFNKFTELFNKKTRKGNRKSHLHEASVVNKLNKYRKKWKRKKKHGDEKKKRKKKVHQRQMDYHTQLTIQQHRHPMNGHRYGDDTYQHTHKLANHDFSEQKGHYGRHDDMSDNHSNNDRFAEISPDNVPQQEPSNQFYPNREIIGKISRFNSLAGHLTNNLVNFNRGKGWKPVHDPHWRQFIDRQQRLENLKVAQQGMIESFHNQDKNSCHRGLTLRGATLRGGILSGEFKSIGVVETQKQCVDLCCKSRDCDIAMTVGRECINIKCFNRKNCNVAPAGHLALRNVLPITTFVQHSDGLSRRSEIPRPMTVSEVIRQLEESEEEDIQHIIDAANTYP